MIALTRVCPICGKAQCLTIKDSENYDEGMKRIREGESSEVVFPNFTPAQRDFVTKGTCRSCWKEQNHD